MNPTREHRPLGAAMTIKAGVLSETDEPMSVRAQSLTAARVGVGMVNGFEVEQCMGRSVLQDKACCREASDCDCQIRALRLVQL